MYSDRFCLVLRPIKVKIDYEMIGEPKMREIRFGL